MREIGQFFAPCQRIFDLLLVAYQNRLGPSIRTSVRLPKLTSKGLMFAVVTSICLLDLNLSFRAKEILVISLPFVIQNGAAHLFVIRHVLISAGRADGLIICLIAEHFGSLLEFHLSA